MSRKTLLITTLFIILFLAYNYLFGKKMELTALDDVYIVKTIDDTYSPSKANSVGALIKGQSVKIIGCRNLKDDQVYEVELMNNIKGYVNGMNIKVTSQPSRNPLKGGVVCW